MPTCRLYRKYDISVKVINENRQTHTTNIMRFLDFAYCYLHIYIYINGQKQTKHAQICTLFITIHMLSIFPERVLFENAFGNLEGLSKNCISVRKK